MRRWLLPLVTGIGAWGAFAYLAAPDYWRWRAEPIPPFVTETDASLPGDPVTLTFTGDADVLRDAFTAAGWREAAPVTPRTSLGIAASVLLGREDRAAPVSALLYQGRVQDLAFEKEAGDSADRRHHVRLWQDGDLWWATASFDAGVELSHRTGAVTHRIAPDLVAERSTVLDDLQATGRVADVAPRAERGPTSGYNGGGDPWTSDGTILGVTLTPPPSP